MPHGFTIESHRCENCHQRSEDIPIRKLLRTAETTLPYDAAEFECPICKSVITATITIAGISFEGMKESVAPVMEITILPERK